MRWILLLIVFCLMLPAVAEARHYNPNKPEPVKVKVKKTRTTQEKRKSFRSNIVQGAKNYVGVREYGATVRRMLRNVGLGPAPWCGAFCWYLADRWGMYKGSRPSNPAYVPNIQSWAKRVGASVARSLVRPGMFVTVPGHICVVVKVNGKTITTIGGNESDMVRKQTRSLYSVSMVIDPARVKYR